MSRANIKKAEKLVVQGQLELAIAAYNDVLAAEPQNTGALNAIGDLLIRTGNGKAAVPHFKKAARIYEKEGFLKKSIAVLRKAHRQLPDDPEAVQHLAKLHVEEGMLGEARNLLLELAQKQFAARKFAEARVSYRYILQFDPGCMAALVKIPELAAAEGDTKAEYESYVEVGRKLADAGRLQEAVRMLEKASEENPGHRGVATLLAGLRGRPSPAAAKTPQDQGPATGNPKQGARLAMEGQEALQKGDAERAGKLFLQARRIHPLGEPVLLLGGNIAWHQGDLVTAHKFLEPLVNKVLETQQPGPVITLLEEIASIEPDHAKTLRTLETIYTHLGNRERLLSVLDRLSTAYEKAQDFEAAIEAATRLQGHEPETLKHKARIERLHGLAHGTVMFEESEPKPALSAEAIEVAPDLTGPSKEEEVASAEINKLMLESDIFLRYGLRDKALALLTSSAERFPNVAELQEKIGGINFEAGDHQRAMNAYSRAAELYESRNQADKVKEMQSMLADLALAAEPEPVAAPQAEPAPAKEQAPPAEPEAEPPTVQADSLAAELAEARLYLDQGFFSPAHQLLNKLKYRHPKDHEVAELWERLQRQVAERVKPDEMEEEIDRALAAIGDSPPVPSPETDPKKGEAIADIARELEQELADVHTAAALRSDEIESKVEAGGAERILSHIAIDAPGEPVQEDLKLHFDLGLAYQETGLLQEAIIEFQLASEDPDIRPKVCLHLGICFRASGMADHALRWIQRGLACSDDNQLSADLWLQAALIYRQLGDQEKVTMAKNKLRALAPDHPGVAALEAQG